MSYIEELAEEYRKGGSYIRSKVDLHRLASEGRPDCFAVNQMSNMLPNEDEHTAEQMVRLLVDLAVQTDPFNQMLLHKYNAEGPLVRDEAIIRILIETLLKSKFVSINKLCEKILQEQVPHDLLFPFAERFITAIERDKQYFYNLTAKAQNIEIYERVRKAATGLDGKANSSAEIALAALGDGKLEQKLILEFSAEKDPMTKVSKAKTMAYIGTPGALYALGSEMRSHLVQVIPGAFARSVRIYFIPLLQYAFPLEEELYHPIKADEDYIRVEKFVERKLGVKWDVERPSFLTERRLAPGFSYTPPK